jgi:hypothetical protein
MTPKEADASSVERWDEPNLQEAVKLYAPKAWNTSMSTPALCV